MFFHMRTCKAEKSGWGLKRFLSYRAFFNVPIDILCRIFVQIIGGCVQFALLTRYCFFFAFRILSFGSFCIAIPSCFLKNWCCTIWDCTFTVELSELNHTVTIYNMWICTGITWNSGCKLVGFTLEIGVVCSATLLWKILGMHLIGGHCFGAGNLQRAWFSETCILLL